LLTSPHESPDKAARVQQMFGAISRTYDLNNRLHSFGRDQAWRRAAVRLAQVKSTDHVLDVACGTGDLTEAFCDVHPASVTGVDFTPSMLELAASKTNVRRRSPGVPAPRYQSGDAMDLEFADASFDIVSIAFGIRNVADPARAVSEFRRVLRPGGRLVVLEFDQPANPIARLGNNIYCRHIMPLTATLIARDRSGAYRYLPRSVQTFLSAGQIAQLMQQQGFVSTQIKRLTFGVCAVTLGRLPASA
jgi:demethylmenaquinone methyltransferase/2-methoxy-6-polyprenyl-1,4-benzoquinol methylase